MKLGKKGLFGEGLIIFVSAILIVAILLLVFIFFDFNNKSTHTIEDVKKKLDNNLFVVGMLRSYVTYEGSVVPLSNLISRYNIENKDEEKKLIQERINSIMKKTYNKDVCWKLTINKIIDSGVKNCELAGKDESISSIVTLAGFDGASFNAGFETSK